MSATRQAAEYLQTKLEAGDFSPPVGGADVNSLAILHALKATADGMKRITEQQDENHRRLVEVASAIHGMDTRLSIIEANSLAHKVEALETRVRTLENEQQRRLGAVGLVEWMGKNWPAIVAFVALVVYVAGRGVHQ